ncbi:2OG-Fe(II) oxygenase [Alteromonas sp. ASW11-36]|uniref:2OG-Fe(II) oxygenase n=1 Tax=Alteromonas arenosi TaxID=3055817 RepID=A0ABT7SV61_9ALTE|nr:2OG-Fe(II) oxygenase [Alteromonas sp. ASW11-36]MDM7860071.1 2OG-Fe(II) oxygenase [Alteromonas sp. ASW11-36]
MNGESFFQRAMQCFAEQDSVGANHALQQAADAGHPMGTLYLAEQYFREDASVAFDFLRKQWHKGVPGTLHRLITLKAFFTDEELEIDDLNDLYLEGSRGHIESLLVLAHLTLDEFPQNPFIGMIDKLVPQLIVDLGCTEHVPSPMKSYTAEELSPLLTSALWKWRTRAECVTELSMERCGIRLYKNVCSKLASAYMKLRLGPMMQPSMVHDPHTGKGIRNEVRTSYIVHVTPEHIDWFVLELDDVLETLTGVCRSRGESMNLLRYQSGQEYKPHYDAIVGQGPQFDQILTDGGQRIRTAITYLSDDYSGGETVFPKLGIKIKAAIGDVLVFNNLTQDGNVELDSYHAGAPVEKGTKWVLTRWIRESATHYGRVVYPKKVNLK